MFVRSPTITKQPIWVWFVIIAGSLLMILIASRIPWGAEGYYVADTMVVVSLLLYMGAWTVLLYGYFRPWFLTKWREWFGY